MKSFFSQKENKILIAILFVLLMLRIPSFFEPHWYMDEGIYGSVSYVLSQGGKLYQDVYDHKPQLLFYLYWLMGNTHKLLFIKIANFIAAALGTIFVFKIMKRASSKLAAVVAAGYFAVATGSYFLEGNIANAENFFVPLSAGALYLFLKAKNKYDFIAGLMLGIAFLIKLHPLFDLAAVLFFLLVQFLQNKADIKQLLTNVFVKRGIMLLAGFILPFLLVSLWELYNNNFSNFIQAAFVDAYRYSGANPNTGIFAFIFSLPVKTLLLGIVILVAGRLYHKKMLSKFAFFAITVFAFEFYGSVISGRYYPHYLLHPTLGFALCLGHLVSTKFRKPNRKNLFQLALVLFAVFSVGELLFSSGFSNQGNKSYVRVKAYGIYRGFDYYADFMIYLLKGKLGSQEYADTFHRGPRKLEYLKQIVDKYNHENVYVYNDIGWTYYYIERTPPDKLVVSFHLFFAPDKSRYERAIKVIDEKVTFIAIEKSLTPFPELTELINRNYFQIEENEYYDFYIKVN